MLIRYYEHDREEGYCEKRPREAFVRGYYRRCKVKRHRSKKYDQYHYFLPANVSPMLKFFREYFYTLDQSFKDVPPDKQYRQSEFEYAEMAVEVMMHIRARIVMGDAIVAGSGLICPVAWAVFGPNREDCWSQNHFAKLSDVIKYYKTFIPPRGFNTVNIDRPVKTEPDFDRLNLLSELIGESVNLVLTCSLYLLFDLLRHCGPDCNEFHYLFSNNKGGRQMCDIDTWFRARLKVIPDNKPDFGDLWLKEHKNNHSITLSQRTSTYYHRPEKEWPGFSTVTITDAEGHRDLIKGEKVEYFEVRNKKQPVPGLHDIEDYTEDDLVDDEMVQELDREYRDIIGPPEKNNLRKKRQEPDSWSGLFEEMYD